VATTRVRISKRRRPPPSCNGRTASGQARIKRLSTSGWLVDSEYADAYARAQDSWAALDTHAENCRADAFTAKRRSPTHAAATHAAGLRPHLYAPQTAGGRPLRSPGWRCFSESPGNFGPYGYAPGQYRTAIGEQKVVDLEDHSTIVLDAATRLRVRYTPDARIVELQNGQAQFTVAKDPTRPFKS